MFYSHYEEATKTTEHILYSCPVKQYLVFYIMWRFYVLTVISGCNGIYEGLIRSAVHGWIKCTYKEIKMTFSTYPYQFPFVLGLNSYGRTNNYNILRRKSLINYSGRTETYFSKTIYYQRQNRIKVENKSEDVILFYIYLEFELKIVFQLKRSFWYVSGALFQWKYLLKSRPA